MRFPPFNPYIAVIIGVMALASTPIFVKSVHSAPAEIIATYRLLYAALAMAPITLIKYRNELKYISKKDWLLLGLAGIFLAFHFVLWFESLNYTSVTSSVIIIAMQPIFILIGMYIFFRERFSFAAVISMLIALFGIIIIFWNDSQTNVIHFRGDILALLATVSITIYFLLGQTIRIRLSLITYMFLIYSIGSLFLIAYNLLFHHSFIQSFTNYPNHYWWFFISVAIIPTFFGHLLFNWSLKWVSASTISFANVFVPIGSALLAYVLLNEFIPSSHWLGGTIAIFGIFLFIVSNSRKRRVTISQKEWE